MRYFEDFKVGEQIPLGEWTFTREDIIRFAEQWDPQPFHLDEKAGQQTHFGGLVASGWHTGCVFMRLYVDSVLRHSASLGSPGMQELRWLEPVRPGDTLHGIAHILELQPSSKRADRGTVFMRWEMVNQHGAVVMRAEGRGYFGRRPH